MSEISVCCDVSKFLPSVEKSIKKNPPPTLAKVEFNIFVKIKYPPLYVIKKK